MAQMKWPDFPFFCADINTKRMQYAQSSSGSHRWTGTWTWLHQQTKSNLATYIYIFFSLFCIASSSFVYFKAINTLYRHLSSCVCVFLSRVSFDVSISFRFAVRRECVFHKENNEYGYLWMLTVWIAVLFFLSLFFIHNPQQRVALSRTRCDSFGFALSLNAHKQRVTVIK